MKLLLILCVVLVTFIPASTRAGELPEEAQKMLDDLGAPAVQQQNNGKTFRCLYGGRKTVTVSPLADATLFSGDYFNCREEESTRDGYYEVIVRDWQIVGQSTKKSINSLLHEAVNAGDLTKVRHLIAKGADVNYAESIPLADGGEVAGWTPLMKAVINGNTNIVKVLLKAGAWVNYMNSSAVSALWLAADKGSLELVKLLTVNKAYIDNSNDDDVTPLMSAATNGHYSVVQYLVKAKADINHIHKDGDTALMFALANNHSEIAKFLIDAGADINIRNKFGVTALLIAVAENNEGMVGQLIQHKANQSVLTDGGKSAMDIAQAKGNKNIIKILTQAQVETRR